MWCRQLSRPPCCLFRAGRSRRTSGFPDPRRAASGHPPVWPQGPESGKQNRADSERISEKLVGTSIITIDVQEWAQAARRRVCKGCHYCWFHSPFSCWFCTLWRATLLECTQAQEGGTYGEANCHEEHADSWLLRPGFCLGYGNQCCGSSPCSLSPLYFLPLSGRVGVIQWAVRSSRNELSMACPGLRDEAVSTIAMVYLYQLVDRRYIETLNIAVDAPVHSEPWRCMCDRVASERRQDKNRIL